MAIFRKIFNFSTEILKEISKIFPKNRKFSRKIFPENPTGPDRFFYGVPDFIFRRGAMAYGPLLARPWVCLLLAIVDVPRCFDNWRIYRIEGGWFSCW